MYAKYTVLLKTLMDNEQAFEELQKSLSTYPIYTPEKLVDMIPTREELNQKLLNHYKYREIGFETTGRFFDELKITKCEIMPHYNELFKSVEIMHDLPSPFDNVDVTETFEETKTGTANSNVKSTSELSGNDETSSTASGTSTDNSTNNSKSVKSNTPQNLLGIGTEGINSVNYADEVSWNQSTNNNTSESSTTSSTNSNSSSSGETETTGTNENEETTKHTFKKVGNQGVNTYAHDMNEFRTSIIDVVNQIITDERIEDLFMKVY